MPYSWVFIASEEPKAMMLRTGGEGASPIAPCAPRESSGRSHSYRGYAIQLAIAHWI